MIPFPHLVATAFLHPVRSGTTFPCVFRCEDPHDATIHGEYVVKLRSGVRGGRTGLLFEFVAAQLAAYLGVPMPTPALIEIGHDVAAMAHGEAATVKRIHNSVGLNFGTKRLGGYTTWRPNERVPDALISVATDIMAFDFVIDNADRRKENPNLLWNSDRLLVIDHETAFTFTRQIPAPANPFDETNLHFLTEHPLRNGLLYGEVGNLVGFSRNLTQLDDRRIDEIFRAIPSEFGQDHTAEIRDRLQHMRQHVQDVAGTLWSIL